MNCPIDQEALVKKIYEADVEIDECPTCGGIWLDNGELESIQKTIENDYSEELKSMPNYIGAAYEMAKAKNEATRSCPSCDADLEKKEYGYCSQIIIDKCPSCKGVWLDKDELKKLEIFFEKQHKKAASQDKNIGVIRGFFASLFKH